MRTFLPLPFAAALLAASPLPAAVPRFHLFDTAGARHEEAEWRQAPAVLLFFVTTDCPLSNGYVPEMNRIAQAYAARGVRVYGVLGDATVPDEDARRHVKEYGYTFPVLFDPQESLAAFTGATVTPEAAVLSGAGEVLYLGRIDNSVEHLGTTRYQATEFDLRDALDAVLAGRPVTHPRTTAFGCAITPKQ